MTALQKASVGGASTNDEDAQHGASIASFLPSVGAFSTAAYNADLLFRVPAYVTLVEGVAVTLQRTEEGQALPLVKPVLDAAERLVPVPFGALVVASDELWRMSGSAAQSFVNYLLRDASARGLDQYFLAQIAAGTADVPLASTSTADVQDALRKALNIARAKGGARLFWVAAPDTANLLASRPNDFPGVTAGLNSTLLGVPCYFSDAAEAGTLTLVDGNSVGALIEGPWLDRSNAATVLMDDAPAMDSTTPTPGPQMVSLFQTNSSAVRITLRAGVELVRSDAAARITGFGG
ncbi:phage major capsid family protein [Paenirhodobacter populi]|uniref:phage major capsid family protein n=1 Tax=Paenirhodobacter populi TaxID=2306993 RepID=UPI0013E2DEAA|nr:phage major capsid protein [Sinirhodobacter populi]